MPVYKKKTQSQKHKFADLNHIFKDIDDWPQSWAGDDDDIPVGQLILNEIKAFLNKQLDRSLSKKTLKRYGDYLWVLGGEIIRDTSCNEVKSNDLKADFLLDYVDELGGPYWRHAVSEQDTNGYNSVCRKFYKFLSNK